MIEETQLDDFSTYYFNPKDDIIVVLSNRTETYTREDLIKFHRINQGKIFLDLNTNFLINRQDNLLFIPLFNRNGFLVEYAYSEYDNYNVLSKYKFNLHMSKKKKYAHSSEGSMHEIIFGRKASEGHTLDHIDSNGLDNRKSKIREISNSANNANRVKKENTTSQYIGVSFDKDRQKWFAKIKNNGQQIALGRFDTEKSAAIMRDIFAVDIYKECAKLNKDSSGDFLLSKEEIDAIIKFGVPLELQRQYKKRDLPNNIYLRDNGTYRYIFEYNGKRHAKTFKTLDEAQEGLDQKRCELNQIGKEAKLLIENDIIRNNQGIAYINTRSKDGKINGEFLLDDEDWKMFIHHNWHIHETYYAQTSDKIGDSRSLHVLVYIIHNGPVPKGKSIDHINSDAKHDCRSSNIRAATPSQQAQNKTYKREAIIQYKGVYTQNGLFNAKSRFNNVGYQKGPFVTMEEAALAYNELVLKHHGKDAKVNVIITKNTSSEKLYGKSNLTLELLTKIKTLSDIRAIFYANSDWKKLAGVTSLSKIKKNDISKYADIIIQFKKAETNA
jgi:hypothetical protein